MDGVASQPCLGIKTYTNTTLLPTGKASVPQRPCTDLFLFFVASTQFVTVNVDISLVCGQITVSNPKSLYHTLLITESIMECPQNCHGNGDCLSGICHCFPGFLGPECSRGKHTHTNTHHSARRLVLGVLGAVLMSSDCFCPLSRRYLSDLFSRPSIK